MSCTSRSHLLSEISSSVNGSRKSLVSNLSQLDEGCREFEGYYREYDYDGETPANGYRSFVSIVDSLMNLVAVQVPATSGKKEKLLRDYETVSTTLIKVMAMLRLSRHKGSTFDTSIVTDTDIDVLEQVFSMSAGDIEPLFNPSVGAFWLKESAVADGSKAARAMLLFSTSLWKKVRILSSASYAAKLSATHALSMDVQAIKSLIRKAESFPLNILMKMGSRVKGVTSRIVNINRSSEWVISVKDTTAPASLHKSPGSREGSVRCLLVRPGPGPSQTGAAHDGKSLVIHMHGGAFILGKPEFFLPFLGPLSQQLNLPLISIDYRLAPEHRYPAAVQDILDVYLFLTSGSPEVTDLLGFQPSNIIVAGESAGANLAIVLTIALHAIRKTGTDVIMPKGVAAQFPCVTAGPVGYPANVFFSMDPTLTAALCAIVFTEYAETVPPAPPGWHRQVNRREVMHRLRERAKDPFFNILSGTHVDELTDVALSILLCEFDPLLDQGIMIAKRWGGEVRIRVARGLPHGLAAGKPETIADELDWITAGIADRLGLKHNNAA